MAYLASIKNLKTNAPSAYAWNLFEILRPPRVFQLDTLFEHRRKNQWMARANGFVILKRWPHKAACLQTRRPSEFESCRLKRYICTCLRGETTPIEYLLAMMKLVTRFSNNKFNLIKDGIIGLKLNIVTIATGCIQTHNICSFI